MRVLTNTAVIYVAWVVLTTSFFFFMIQIIGPISVSKEVFSVPLILENFLHPIIFSIPLAFTSLLLRLISRRFRIYWILLVLGFLIAFGVIIRSQPFGSLHEIFYDVGFFLALFLAFVGVDKLCDLIEPTAMT